MLQQPICRLPAHRHLSSWTPYCLQLAHKEGALSGQATIRGAYINTASKDVGLDPDYHKIRKDPIVGNGPLGSGR